MAEARVWVEGDLAFWEKVGFAGLNDCWNFAGAKCAQGYGRVRYGGKACLAHRVAFFLTNGTQPEAVCHKCDNPSCCNPLHLFGGTKRDNNLDMARKERNRVPRTPLRGQGHHQAKLSDADAAAIRAEYALRGISQRQIAAKFGVCQRSIAKVVNRVSFRNVG